MNEQYFYSPNLKMPECCLLVIRISLAILLVLSSVNQTLQNIPKL